MPLTADPTTTFVPSGCASEYRVIWALSQYEKKKKGWMLLRSNLKKKRNRGGISGINGDSIEKKKISKLIAPPGLPVHPITQPPLERKNTWFW